MSAIIVVEPHPLLRLGILQLLSTGLPDYSSSGVDCVDSFTPSQAGCECLLLMLSIDVAHDFVRHVAAAERAFQPKYILLMSDSADMPEFAEPLPPKVTGYVPKNAAPEILLAAVRLVMAGGSCFPPSSGKIAQEGGPGVPPEISAAYAQSAPASIVPGEAVTNNPVAMSECQKLGLTPRQYEVLVLLARGYPMKTVGRLLNISVATAKAHSEMLYQRLDVHNRNAAVFEAISRGATLGWPNLATAQQQAGLKSPAEEHHD